MVGELQVGEKKWFDSRTISSTREVVTVDPLLIVSADSHVTAPAEDYIGYLDAKYREFADDFRNDVRAWHKIVGHFGYPYDSEVLDIIDTRGARRTGGEMGVFDPMRRLREVEAEGVVAEILHPTAPLCLSPFFDAYSSPRSPELRAAGAAAHNRFLTEFCSSAPERLLGVYLTYPWPDMDAAVAACIRAKDAGAKAVFPAQQAGVPDDPCPAFYDRIWDRFWGACQELGLVVQIHAGWGNEQGHFTRLTSGSPGDDTNDSEEPDFAILKLPIGEAFDTFVERRPLWQLMWSGVFDRFPGLKVCFAEVHGDWVPGTLAHLERRYERDRGPMKLRPTEYWRRHCAIGGSLMRHSDVAARYELGVERLMFGTDFPHSESTWPNSRDWIHTVLGQVDLAETRQILGENAIKFYGLNEDVLREAACRCGPLPGAVFGAPEVDPRILAHFEVRAGIGKSPDLHEPELLEALDIDLGIIAQAGTAPASGFVSYAPPAALF